MIKSISEILKEVAGAPKSQRAERLRYYQSPALCTVLRGALDETIEWLLPEGTPPYNESKFLDEHGSLYGNVRKFYLFVVDNGVKGIDLPSMKREQLFIELLESIEPQDAKLLCFVKDKKLPHKEITADLVQEAFPGLLKKVKEKHEQKKSVA
jgi:hypothetical protein